MEFNSRCNGNLKVRLEFDESALVKDFFRLRCISGMLYLCIWKDNGVSYEAGRRSAGMDDGHLRGIFHRVRILTRESLGCTSLV